MIWSILWLSLPGCMPKDQDATILIPVKLSVADGVTVKSSHTMGESEVGNLTIALYENGHLSREYYFDSTDGIQLTNLPQSRYYTVYALANVAHISFPAHETDIVSLRIPWSSVSSAGWPMACSGNLEARTGAVLSLQLVRLVARVDLKVDAAALSLYSFTAQSVLLLGGAKDCRPFLRRSVPLTGSVHPDAASATDVAAMNTGAATSYYLFESCFGDLMPDNQDAWNKVPSQLPSGVDPPYVEIAGRLTCNDNSGTNRAVTYRFYLGQDATRNFDVIRNTVTTVTLVLHDDNVENGSWKVEAGPYDEKASLAFKSAALELPWMTSSSVAVLASPANLVYRVYEKNGSMSNAGLTFQRDGNVVYVTSTQDSAKSGTLYVGTLDGRLERACQVNTVKPPVVLEQIVLRCLELGRDHYVPSENAYAVPIPWTFDFAADLFYSDATSVTNVRDFNEFEWVIADENVVHIYPGWPNTLYGNEPGMTEVYIKKDNVSSNTLNLLVYIAELSVRSVPANIASGDDCILIATCEGGEVEAEWEIISGSEYGHLEDRLYTTFVSNGLNTTPVYVTIAGHYKDEVATCVIAVRARK